MLAYLHSRPPPFDISTQNLPEPVAACFFAGPLMVALDPLCAPAGSVPLFMLEGDCVGAGLCALAIAMPASKAATAVMVVRVFMMCLLGGHRGMPRSGTATTGLQEPSSWN